MLNGYDVEILFPTGANLSKNPGDAEDSTVFLSPRDICTVPQVSGVTLTSNGEDSLQKK